MESPTDCQRQMTSVGVYQDAPTGTNYFYDQLSDTDQYIYRAAYYMATTNNAAILDLTEFTNANYNALLAVSLDHPELISYAECILGTTAKVSVLKYSDTATKKVLYYKLQYSSSYVSYASQESELVSKAKSFLDEHIDQNQPEAVIAKEIHDALILNVSYDTATYEAESNNKKVDDNNLSLAHSAYGALVNGKAVCDGYANAYKYLCGLCGINAIVIRGEAGTSSAHVGHAWNAVKLGDDWYDLDVTWDDPTNVDNKVYTTFYNLPTSSFQKLEVNGTYEYHKPSTASNELTNYLPEAKGMHFNRDYMYYKDTQAQTLNYYHKDHDSYKKLSLTGSNNEWNIHVLTDEQKEDDVIWKIKTTLSGDLVIQEDWKDHVLKVKKVGSSAGTGQISSTIYFDNGQTTTLDETLTLEKSTNWNSDYTIDVEPTCTTAGSKSIHSTDGTKIKSGSTVTIPKLGHDYGTWQQYDSTKHKHICSRDSSHVEYADHNFESEVTTKPTCTKEGVKTYTCKDCNYSYTEAVTALGHNYSQYQTLNGNDANYATKHYLVCSLCGDQKEENHEFTSVVTTEPTCTSEGVRTYTCKDCGYSYTESIPALGHGYGNWEQYNATQHKRVCKNDSSHVDYENHSFTSSVIEPTCTNVGVKTYTCSVCGYSYSESIPAIGHTYGGWTIENATTHVRYCSRDHDAQREAHHFDGGIVTKKSTTSKAGTKVYTCADCGYQKTVKLAKLKGIVVVTNKKVKVKGNKVTTKTKTVKLKTNGLKGKKIWKVSNKKIAKVKNGKVTFKKKGKVTVTLKCGKKKYKVTITYKK